MKFNKEIITFITTAIVITLLILTAIPPATAVYLDAGTPSTTSLTKGNTVTFHNVNLTIRGAERIPVEYLNFSIFRNSDDQCIAYVEFYINGSEKSDPLNKFSIQLVTPINFSSYWGNVTYGYDENTGWNGTLAGYGYGYGDNSYGDLTILYNISYITHATGTFYARLFVNATSHTYQSSKSTTFKVSSPPSTGGGGGGPSNSPPVADANGPYTGYVNKAVPFDGTGSYDSDGTIVNYTWDFGDGTKGYGETTTHVYSNPGTYQVTLTVKDDDGATGSDTTTAMILNQTTGNLPPVAKANGPYSGLTGGEVLFKATGSYDPDGTIVNYTWDFGDGTKGYGETTTHVYDTAGLYTVILTVEDNNGATGSDTTTVDIALDTDGDGWSDTEEEIYGTNPSDPNDTPIDTDGDRIPDDYDENDDNDALDDEIEELIGSNPKDPTDVEAITSDWYLVDTNGDGVYDEFYDSSNAIMTPVEIGENGEILIDTNGDGVVDYVYDPASGEISTYEKAKAEAIPIIFIILGVIAVIIIVIIILFKMGYIYIEEEDEEK